MEQQRPAIYDGLTPCDLVMKGGVASGIVYPGAIAEIGDRYYFKAIGGASAGAIGAIGAAAAELGRYTGDSAESFAKVRRLTEDLQRPDDIIGNLFQPQPATEGLFNTAVAIGETKLENDVYLFWRAAVYYAKAFPNFPGWAIGGLLISLIPAAIVMVPAILAAVEFGITGIVLAVLVAIFAIPMILIGSAIGIILGVRKAVLDGVVSNFYGMCSGLTEPDHGHHKGLTDWMFDLVNDLALRPQDDPPVTYRDLWYPNDDDRASLPGGIPPSRERIIDLQVMTTCLSEGRPYRFPFDSTNDPQQQFYFRRKDFKRLFPANVLAWLEDHPPVGAQPVDGYLPLPEPADLPVAMAARLSLSFPGLLSAIPLYRLHGREMKKCWFSDGGIASNFPIHFFDSPLPRWPTLAINLAGAPQNPCSAEEWRQDHGACQSRSIWAYPEDVDPTRTIDSVSQFGWAIFNTARNWNDNLQAQLPGYRDRIIYIGMNPEEGGLNLRMPVATRQLLAERGEMAGQRIRSRFHDRDNGAPTPRDAWHRHRWARYRSSMAAIEGFLASYDRGYTHPANPTYHQLILDGLCLSDDQFGWEGPAHMKRALAATQGLANVAAAWKQQPGPDFGVHAPEPEPELRIRPQI
jgi:predicted acylesterase/phospholipase RssA